MQIISIYDKEKHSKGGGTIDIDTFFGQIQDGTYKDKVNEIRLSKYNFKLEEKRCENLTKEEVQKDEKYQKAKSSLKDKKGSIHRVTISGKFSEESREEKSLITHSGLIDIDIDRIDESGELEVLKQKLSQDKFCVSCFVSCGGDGLSWICRIDTTRHSDSYDGLAIYLFKNYGISIDVTHRSVANTRNISYDPTIFIADHKPPVFKQYPKDVKKKVVKNTFVYAKNDFEEIISEIVKRKIDFCDTYEVYRNIGFAIASKFGPSGLYYFNSVCQWNDKYNEKNLERDYIKYFCKNPSGGVTIATFYSRCKDFNISTSSKETSRIATIASASMRGGKTKEDTIKNIVKFEGVKEEDCKDIVNQIFDEKIDFECEDSLLEDIETYIRHNYNLIKNSITGKIENDGVEWTEEDLNGLYIKIKKTFEKADARWIERVIWSPFIPSYNPFLKFFQDNEDKMPDELLEKREIPSIIKKLWRSIHVKDQKHLEKFGTMWLVSIISAAHGIPSNLELDFTGKLEKGKSFFFKNLLPKQLQKYFAETTLEKEKDDEILMCMKLLILIDECGGKTRNDEKKHKRLLDKEIFSLRRPYRKDNEDIKRLAVLGGTSNPQNLNTDTHGNRRIIFVDVLSRNFKEYDEIDKTELMMAAYHLWKEGYKWQILGDDIKELAQFTLFSNDYSLEYEVITKYFDKGDERLTASDIKIFLEDKTNQKLSLGKISNELKRLEFEIDFVDNSGVPKNTYRIRYKDISNPIQSINTPFIAPRDYFN